MAAKGPSTRDKFFLDFVAGATQLSDPFGLKRNESRNIDWLPQLNFFETDEPLNAVDAQESVDELRALFARVDENQNHCR